MAQSNITMPNRATARLAIGLKVFAGFAMLTGAADIVDGVRLLISSGAQIDAVARDAVLNSQVRYLGAIWAGFGAMLWWTTNDLSGRQRPLEILCAAVFIGGVGRTITALVEGVGSGLLIVFIVVELAGPPFVLLVHRHYAERAD